MKFSNKFSNFLAMLVLMLSYACGQSGSQRSQGASIAPVLNDSRSKEGREYDIDQYLPKEGSSTISNDIDAKNERPRPLPEFVVGATLSSWYLNSDNVVLCSFIDNVLPPESDWRLLHFYDGQGNEIPFEQLVFMNFEFNGEHFLTVSVPLAYQVTEVTQGSGNEIAIPSDMPDLQLDLDCNGLDGSWVLVPGDPDYNTTDFCIMKYEAKEGANGPVSRWDDTPWVDISQVDARSACESLGPRFKLISNEQWMTVTSRIAANSLNWIDPADDNDPGKVGVGVLFEGHTDDNPGSACEAAEDDRDRHVRAGSCEGVDFGNADQRRTHEVTNGSNINIIWDLAGNVNEWVDYYDQDKVNTEGSVEIKSIDDNNSKLKLSMLLPINKRVFVDIGVTVSNWDSDQGIGRYRGGAAGSGGAMYRGGRWDRSTSSGLFSAGMDRGQNDESSGIGFRCTYQ